MADLEFIKQQQIFAVIRTATPELARTAAAAVIKGNIKLVEITLTTPQATEVIKELSSQDGIQVGAGSVTTVEEASAALAAGARFLISPVCEPRLIPLAHEADAVIILGGLTPTEIWQAYAAGADLVKVFPVEALGGPQYIKYLKGPLPGLQLLASGGVTPQNMVAYLQSGVQAIGLSASLIDPEALKKNQLDKITHTANSLVKTLQSYRWLKT